MTADTGSAQVSTVGDRPNVLVLEGELLWEWDEVHIGEQELGHAMIKKWPDERSLGAKGMRTYRFTIERLG